MTINCYSNEKILHNLGDWLISDLDIHRDDYLFEANKADIYSKSQMLYIKTMDKKNTNLVDWSCSYCGDTIKITAIKKKLHWKEFLCSTCVKIGYKTILNRSVIDFHKHLQYQLRVNLSHEDDDGNIS